MLLKPIWENGKMTRGVGLVSVKGQMVSSMKESGLTIGSMAMESQLLRMDPGRRGSTRITS